ncbi:T9SS type A sorting domain-containing protein [Pontibacter populi]|uniref:T9SS type A sorting domain-containing protein n=1 Tax=Pontibacter populi TaxID=890055 RepID=A0ABV1RR15_9BACT
MNIVSQAVDHEQNLVVLGYTGANSPERKVVLHKINQEGTIVWARTYTGEPGSISNSPSALNIDSKGNIYVSGTSDMVGTYKRFLIRYSSDGAFAWSKLYSYDSGINSLQSFKVGADDAIYLTGTITTDQKRNIRTQKLDATGAVVWEKLYEPEIFETGYETTLEVDNKGSVYVATNARGYYSSYNFTLIKYSAALGEQMFTQQYGSGTLREELNKISVSPTGNIYVFTSAKSPSSGNYNDLYMYVLSGTGTLLNKVRVGDGIQISQGIPIFNVNDVEFNADNELILLGTNARYRSHYDYFMSKYSADGTRVWLKTLNVYEGSNIKQFVSRELAILDNQEIAVIGDYSVFIEINGFPPVRNVIEKSKLILALFDQSGNETWRYLNQKNNDVENYGTGISKIGGRSVYATGGIAGTQPSTFAMKFADCSGLTANAGTDKEICTGSSVQLQAAGGTTYSWAPATGLSATNIANPVATPAVTTTYTVTVTNAEGCTATDEVVVKVNEKPTATIIAGGETTFCQGGSVVLTANSGTDYSYQWLKNGTPVNQAITKTFTATTAGDYAVIVKNAEGCSATSAIVKVSVTAAVTASAGADEEICAGANVQLQATGGTTYSWSPATGLSATNVANPVASPTTTTIYTVTVSNANGCSATDQVIVKVTANPTATITANGATTFCEGGSLVLNANQGTGYSYQWYKDGNPINQATGSSFTTSAAGDFTVKVTMSSGCSATSSPLKVTVNKPATVVAGTAQSVCANAAAFTLSGFSPAGGTWSGTGVSAAGLFNPATAGVGTHTLTYTVNQNNCSATATKTITVTPTVNTPGAINGTTTVCSGATNLAYTINAVAGAESYTWTVPGGFTITSGQGTTSIKVTAGGSNSGNITVTASNGCGTSAPATIAVNLSTLAAATITPEGTTTFCEGGSVTLKATAGANYSYQWMRNGTAVSGAASANYTATTSGNYTVRISNGNCSETSSPVAVNVTASISNNAISSGNQNVCVGAAVANLQGSVPTGGSGNYSYQWQQSSEGTTFSAISGATSQNYSPGNLSNTTWFRRVVTAGGCSSTSDAVKVTINAAPTVTLAALNKVCTDDEALTLAGGQPAGGTYSGTGVNNGVFSPATAGAGEHIISYTFTDASGCSATATQTIVVEEACNVTGVEDDEPPHKFAYFPNPAKDKLTLEVQLPDRTDVTIQLIDARGSVVHHQDYTGQIGGFKTILQLQNKARGMYFLRFTTKDGSYNRKVLLW